MQVVVISQVSHRLELTMIAISSRLNGKIRSIRTSEGTFQITPTIVSQMFTVLPIVTLHPWPKSRFCGCYSTFFLHDSDAEITMTSVNPAEVPSKNTGCAFGAFFFFWRSTPLRRVLRVSCEWQDKMAPAPAWCTCLPLACTSLFWPLCSQWYLRWTLFCTWAHPSGPAALVLVSAPPVVGR